MKDKINYGIIGFGRYAEKRLLPAFSKTRFSVLRAFTKRDIGKARNLAQKYHIEYYFDDIHKMLELPELDAVIVTSPPGLHKEHTFKAATFRKHVMVEKPFAVSNLEAEQMVEVCREQKVKCMAAFVMRFIDALEVTRSWIQAGKLGVIDYAGGYFGLDISLSSREWLNDPVLSGGGVIADLGSHFLDLFQFILNRKVTFSQALLKPPFSRQGVENKAIIQLEFEEQIIGSLYLSFNVIRESGLTFHGSKGKLSLKNFNQPEKTVQLHYSDSSGETVRDIQNGNYYAKMIDHFSESIIYDKPVITPGEVGCDNQKLIDGLYKRASKTIAERT